MRAIPVLLLLLPLSSAAQTAPTVAERVLAAAAIPGLAHGLRSAGVSDDEVVDLLDVLSETRVSGTEARLIFTEEGRAVARHGQLSGLGSFVQSKLAAGLRGQALASAIQAEHAARGRRGPSPRVDPREGPEKKPAARESMNQPVRKRSGS